MASAEKETDDFGRQLLMSRRLVEKGVRYIQICNGGGGNGSWDAHMAMKDDEKSCRAPDKRIAGLIGDLKQRGMLDSTLVVFSSDFGPTPWSQNTTGRDHNPRGYSVWLAGGGVKRSACHSSSSVRARPSPDHQKVTIFVFGRTFHVLEEETVRSRRSSPEISVWEVDGVACARFKEPRGNLAECCSLWRRAAEECRAR